MSDYNSIDPDQIRHLRLFFYLMPIFGVFPALWTLYRNSGGRQERALSRFVIKFAFGWLFLYGLLGASASGSESALPLLLIASGLTSGYFVINLWLMVRLWQRSAIGLPLIGQVGKLL